MTTDNKQTEQKTLIVGIPDTKSESGNYVNTRGAALNYVRDAGSNREEAHCADRAE